MNIKKLVTTVTAITIIGLVGMSIAATILTTTASAAATFKFEKSTYEMPVD